MKEPLKLPLVCGWVFGMLVFAIGVLNVILVHPVPGLTYFFLSLVYLPPANGWLQERCGFKIPLLLKIILGVAIFMFTLGVSDLGEIIDKL